MQPKATDGTIRGLSEQALSFWAKSGEDASWLPLAQHMLDSACVAERLWDDWVPDAVHRTLVRTTSLPEPDLRVLAVWLACTHDIGKTCRSFVSQLDDAPGGERYSQRVREAGLDTAKSGAEIMLGRLPHGLASATLLKEWLIDQGLSPRIARSVASIADSHHGIPSDPATRERAADALDDYPDAWKQAQRDLLEWAANLTGIRAALPRLQGRLLGPELNLLTGFVIMADWIASNADGFPLEHVVDQVERTERGLDIDLTVPWRPTAAAPGELDVHMRSRFSWSGDQAPRPVQVAADEVARRATGATLMIIEAPTGEGKTEAALIAAEHLAAATGAGGVILAAPTMSTADGLLQRTIDWAREASAPDEIVSMFLGHSKSSLNRTFEGLRPRGIGQDEIEHAGGTVVASSWMSGRKKGILSNVCVTTVDQVLFLALQARHSMLRHLGLAGKVVIIDEVHAYDAYMTEYLSTALRWLARYGVGVVLLSATLPVAQRRQLIDAYESEFAEPADRVLSMAYPLITTVGADGFRETEVSSRPSDLSASVTILEDALDALSDALTTSLADGGCALVICNTIARAQRTFRDMDAHFPGEVELHHAGFIASDRVEREEALRAALGPNASRASGRPHRRVVVATQVAEQSLDIDVDLLVTDIAPIDLIIQRIGRLHRHQRPDSDRPRALREAQVLIRGIESLEPVPVFEGGCEAVYGRMTLLASLAVLQDTVLENGFTRPGDIAPLVQSAYGETPPIPPTWEDVWCAARSAAGRKRDEARKRSETWRFPDPAGATSLDDQFRARARELGEQAGLAQVRDSDPTIEVIPIVLTESGYHPLPWTVAGPVELDAGLEPPQTLARILAAASVRLPARLSRYTSVFDAVITELEAATPVGWVQSPMLRSELALPLNTSLSIEIAGRRLVYDRRLGLTDITDSSVAPSSVGASL